MTPEELDAIQARADAAAPGPWTVDTDFGHNEYDEETDAPQAAYVPESLTVDLEEYDAMSVATAEFVARAREDVPALVAEVRRLRAAARDALEFLDDIEASDNHATQPETHQGDTFRVVLAGLRIALTGQA